MTAESVHPPDTIALNTDERGELTFERQLLHAAIIRDLLDQQPALDCARAGFTAGGPASGKSRLISALGLGLGAVVIDADDIRKRLPEYPAWQLEWPDKAASLTQREASSIAIRAFALALSGRHRVILDGVGGNDYGQFAARIRATLDQTPDVRVFYATVSVELALEREDQRFLASGRRVPRGYLIAKHAEVSRGFPAIARLKVVEISVRDTSYEPHLLASGRGGDGPDALEVVDPEGYAQFLSKGDA
jgi:hypothetical protein